MDLVLDIVYSCMVKLVEEKELINWEDRMRVVVERVNDEGEVIVEERILDLVESVVV